MPDPITPAPNAPATNDTSRDLLRAAAQRVQADVEAIHADDLEPINREINTVVTTVLGANRLLQPFLPAIATLPGVDVERVRKLGDYTDALLYWSASSTHTIPPNPEIPPMIERAIELRENVLHDLGSLVRHGHFSKAIVDKYGSSIAHRDIAHDLISISDIVLELWPTIEGKTLITRESMDDAGHLGKRILQAIGDRDVSTAEKARDLVLRNKAYTVVVRTYQEARRAIAFLRDDEGDVESIVPSLFTLGPRKKKAADADGVGGTTPAGASSDVLGPKTSSVIVPDEMGI